MVKLPDPTSPTVDAIYARYERDADRKPRTYLGMSTLGQECDRRLWYEFRWACELDAHQGRILRLFETGNREEARMLDDLRAIGIAVQATDPATGGQWELSGLDGHLRGHMDGVGTGFEEAPVTEHVLEFKTHNDASFKKLLKDGVKVSKPGHYIQVQLYMHFRDARRAFYLAHNKNTDELHSERIEYDMEEALRAIDRARRIIEAQEPPPRLHDDPEAKAAWQCRNCPALNICHYGAMPARNCRTCLEATPAPDAKWSCALLKVQNDAHMQRLGCSMHRFIPALVPGEQVDVDLTARVVTYRMQDGSEFKDGGVA